MRPRLLHLTTTDMSLDWLLRPQLVAFAEAGFEVTGASAPGPHVADLEAAGIRHLPLRHVTREMDPKEDLRALPELVSLFRRGGYDIVHTHNPKPGVYGRIAAAVARVPVVVNTVHGLYAQPEDPMGKRLIVYGLERLAAACSDAELLQNPEDFPVLLRLGVPEGRLHLLGNGIDLERFSCGAVTRTAREELRAGLGVRPDEVVCGVVGRLVWEKGYAEIFEAAATLRRSHPRVRFVVIGPHDPAKPDAVDEVAMERAGRAGRIDFLGPRDDMVALYGAMDLYVLASYREGFPRSAMEAAASGLPIVATDVRGCRQVVDHGVTGLLVPVRSGQAIADEAGRLADDRARRAAMARAAREKAEREFDQRRVIDTTLDVYRRLLSEDRPRRRRRARPLVG